MKNIDIKSMIIGVLLTIVIACGVAATGVNDKWDNEQEWLINTGRSLREAGFISYVKWGEGQYDHHEKVTGGWEPFGYAVRTYIFRKRIK